MEDGVVIAGAEGTAAVTNGIVTVLVPPYTVLVRWSVTVLVVSSALLMNMISGLLFRHVVLNLRSLRS